MQGRPDTIETANYIAMGAGGLIIFALTFWHFMLPEAADNLDWEAVHGSQFYLRDFQLVQGSVGTYDQKKPEVKKFNFQI